MATVTCAGWWIPIRTIILCGARCGLDRTSVVTWERGGGRNKPRITINTEARGEVLAASVLHTPVCISTGRGGGGGGAGGAAFLFSFSNAGHEVREGITLLSLYSYESNVKFTFLNRCFWKLMCPPNPVPHPSGILLQTSQEIISAKRDFL